MAPTGQSENANICVVQKGLEQACVLPLPSVMCCVYINKNICIEGILLSVFILRGPPLCQLAAKLGIKNVNFQHGRHSAVVKMTAFTWNKTALMLPSQMPN